MSLFQFPFKRKTYAGINNPRFVSDIQAANEGMLDGLLNVAGLTGSTAFALFWGFNYTPGAPGTYGPGLCVINGSFYLSTGAITEGQALMASPQDIELQPFTDGTPRNIYTALYAAVLNGPVAGSSPAFGGNMNGFRLDNNSLAGFIATIQVRIASLGSAANASIGQGAGQVAAGNDPRFGYTIAQMNAIFAQIANVLTFGNTTPFTPTQLYDPATKAYVDANSFPILAKGFTNVGNADPTGGTLQTFSLGLTLGNTNYKVLFDIQSNSSNPAVDGYHQIIVRSQTTTSFGLYFRSINGSSPPAQNVAVDWVIVPR